MRCNSTGILTVSSDPFDISASLDRPSGYSTMREGATLKTLYGYSTNDLTVYARIRQAALELFAERGVDATPIRDIAARAEVSPGAVQHHFGTKDQLRKVIGEHVLQLTSAVFEELSLDGTPAEIEQQTTAFVADNEVAVRYVARGVADGDEYAVAIFDHFCALVRRPWDRLQESGQLKPDVDIDWATLHYVLLALGTVLMRNGVERLLDGPLDDPEELRRWTHARSTLLQQGLIAEPTSKKRAAAGRTTSSRATAARATTSRAKKATASKGTTTKSSKGKG